MIYGEVITTLAERSIASPLETRIDVVKGFIHHIDVVFPPGPSGLVGLRVLAGVFQIHPVSYGQWFVGDNIHFDHEVSFYLENPPYELTVQTYNVDTAYPHDVEVWFGIVLEEEFIARFAPGVSAKLFAEQIRGVFEEQEAKREAALLAAQAGAAGLYGAMLEEEET